MTLPLSSDVALADDIVSELQQRSWLLPFTVERTWVPEWTVRGGELETLQVSINPSIEAQGSITERDSIFERWTIDVTICQRVANLTRAELDGLADLVEQLRQFLDLATFTLSDGRVFYGQGYEYLARFDPLALERTRAAEGDIERFSGVFKSAFQVTYLMPSV